MTHIKSSFPTYIIFFDGFCKMCNTSVNVVMKLDKKQKIFFAPLQGETAKLLIDKTSLSAMDSFIYKSGSDLYYRSQAVNRLFKDLGGIYRLYSITRVIPYFIQDLVYNFIAKHRYTFFKKRKACRMPTEKEKTQFLK